MVTAKDLVPEAFKRLLPTDLPQQHRADEKGPYFAALARISNAHARKAIRNQAQ